MQTKISFSSKSITTRSKKICAVVLTEEKSSWHRLVEKADGTLEYRFGAGKWSAITPRAFRTLVRSIVMNAKGHQLDSIALELSPEAFKKLTPYGDTWFWRTLTENLTLASYEFTHYKSKSPKPTLQEITLYGVVSKTAKTAASEGLIAAEAVNSARTIANTTGEDMNPSGLVAAAQKLAQGTGVKVTVHNKTKIKQLKMGLLSGVGKGASDGPYLIVMEYFGSGKAKASSRPTILIGKGVTYDTGGLNLKPTGGLHEMHMDMSGGAAVIAAITGAARLKLKRDIVAIIPVAENAISDKSMRAGDILTSMSGLTVEVQNTDAEGRLILADALTYAERFYKPKLIIDVATLTGASLVALGQHASALFTKNDTLREKLMVLSEKSGDLLWPLPLWDEYRQYLKGSRGDLQNMNGPANRYGGAIEGAAFLSYFAPKGVPWAHIEMAPRMVSIASDKLAKGATGEPTRLLLHLLAE